MDSEDKRSGYVVIDSSLEITFILTLMLVAFSSAIHIPLKITCVAILIGILLSPFCIIAFREASSKTISAFWGGFIGLSLGILGVFSKNYFATHNLNGWGQINVTLAVGVGIMLIFSIFRKKLRSQIKKKTDSY